jgi:hypothetical protein
MEGRTMRILSEYIAELHRRDREYYRTTERSSINTTKLTDAVRSQGNRSGNAGRSKNCSG